MFTQEIFRIHWVFVGGILVRRDFSQERFWQEGIFEEGFWQEGFWSGGILVLEGFLRRDFGWRENGILPFEVIIATASINIGYFALLFNF